MGGAARGGPFVVAMLAIACAEPTVDDVVDVSAEAPAIAEAPDPPPLDEPQAPDPLAGLTDDVASGLGAPRRLDDRTGARVRNAIRARIGTRPTLITSRHYVREDRGTVSVSTFTGSYIERCVTSGTPREECLIGQGPGALAIEQSECVFGGIARVDIAPALGDREGEIRSVAVLPIGLGAICVFEVESLALRDEDRDGEPEVILSYGWSDLRRTDDDPTVVDEGSVRLILTGALQEQARLTVRFYHHPTEGDGGDRNLVSQLRFVPRDGRRDIALDVIDWRSDECPESDPPRGRGEICDLRERTVLYPYDRTADRWIAPEDAP